MKYSIDTSSLIGGFREQLPYLIVPQFWTRDLPALVTSGDLRATEEVRFELQGSRGDDEVLAFVSEIEDLFIEVDMEIQREVRAILKDHPRLIHRGRSGADPFVIGLAKLSTATVVCEEGRGKKTKPSIPDVCEALGIKCIKLYQLAIEQGWEYG